MIGLPLSAADVLAALGDHLWQSTWVAAGAALLVWMFRRHRAGVRAAIWLAATLKFLIPFAVLGAIGRAVPWPDVPAVAPASAVAVVQAMSQPFTPVMWDTTPGPASETGRPSTTLIPGVVLALWIGGTLWVLARSLVRARRFKRALKDARVLRSGREADAFLRVANPRWLHRLELRSIPWRSSPCVAGVWRPTLVWPDGLSQRLSDAQLDAVVQHELCHVIRHDNLAASAQAAVQALFWFHPGVWWMGARWNDERERACDEHVLARAHAPEPYAEGLINVGEFCLAPATMAHATITGSRLSERIEAIMNRHTPNTLTVPAHVALVIGAIVLIAAPILVGATTGSAAVTAPVTDALVPAPRPAAPPPVQFTRAEPTGQTTAAQLARVDGGVADVTGASVAGVTVTFTPIGGTTSARSAVTDIDGRFSLQDVPGGEYDVRFAQAGFRSVTQRANIRGGYTTALTTMLPIGSLSEMVTIRGSGAPTAPAPIPEGEWQQRLNNDPDNAVLYLELAELYYQQERFVESDSLVARAVALGGRGLPAAMAPGSMKGQRGGDIKPPRKLKDVHPVYPRTALASRVAGTVVLEATVGRDGSVHHPKILRSVALLDQAALSVVRLWRFTPTLLNGQPVEAAMTVTINFELGN